MILREVASQTQSTGLPFLKLRQLCSEYRTARSQAGVRGGCDVDAQDGGGKLLLAFTAFHSFLVVNTRPRSALH